MLSAVSGCIGLYLHPKLMVFQVQQGGSTESKDMENLWTSPNPRRARGVLSKHVDSWKHSGLELIEALKLVRLTTVDIIWLPPTTGYRVCTGMYLLPYL